MTALVVEGVSLLDMEALDAVTCKEDDNPAVALVYHSGPCPWEAFACAAHVRIVRSWITDTATRSWICNACGDRFIPPDHIIIRPI